MVILLYHNIFFVKEMQLEKVVQTETKQHQPLNLISRQVKLDPKMYTIFRLDGHTFSKFVKKFKMELPFDNNFTTSMKNTALEAFTYFRFFIGFVGSDEITFAMRPLTNEDLLNNKVLQFNGRIEKMVSLLAGKVSTTFFIELSKLQGFQKTKQFCPHFDCRVYQVSTYKDMLDNISQRIVYTLKNSRMMLAQNHFNQKQLNNVPSHLAVEKLLAEKDIDYNKAVHADNRVGNVIIYQKVHEEKEIQVKGVTKIVSYDRRKSKTLNLGPKEIYQFKEEQLL